MRRSGGVEKDWTVEMELAKRGVVIETSRPDDENVEAQVEDNGVESGRHS